MSIFIVRFRDYRGFGVVDVTVEAKTEKDAERIARHELMYACEFDTEDLDVEIESTAKDEPVKRVDFRELSPLMLGDRVA